MDRSILATLHRKNHPVSHRRYARISTALPKAVEVLILTGEPGDVIEFSHAELGFQIGTVKIQVNSRIVVQWVTE